VKRRHVLRHLRYIGSIVTSGTPEPESTGGNEEEIVANFCSKCGAEVSSDKKFCTSCGAPMAAGAAPPFTSQPFSAQPGPPYLQPFPSPPPSGGSSALKIVLIVVAVVVGLGIIGVGVVAFGAWRLSRSIHVEQRGDGMTLHTPGGTISANQSQTSSADELGADIYPGAVSGHGGMKMNLPNGSLVSSSFTTTDSKDKVIAFYKSRFGEGSSVIDTPNGAILSVKKGHSEAVMVTITAQNEGKTQISIMHTKNSKPS
jgi:hypothetical protein